MTEERKALQATMNDLISTAERIQRFLEASSTTLPPKKHFTLIKCEEPNFTVKLEAFLNDPAVRVTFTELQRNVFYRRHDGMSIDELTEELSAFLIWEDVSG